MLQFSGRYKVLTRRHFHTNTLRITVFTCWR